jgi:6-phosphofructokinase 1
MSKDRLIKIGVMTSGGDAPGMNAAVRAIVRTALYKGAEAYAFYQGYNGMVTGEEMISKMTWDSVAGIMNKGGTMIGTARSQEFRTREGRLKAAANLLKIGIDHLVIIGGDGSLTGANTFREEWPSLLNDLVNAGTITRELADSHPHLMIIGLVGSIDNDMSGTDMTIGADTALKRITDAVDMLKTTAAAHKRTFVVEVMGRNCGYLALIGALSTGADYVFIPENPPDPGWEDRLCGILKANRETGKNDSIVLLAEGAKDKQGNQIKAEYIKQVLESKLGHDTRITILGHIQRGGSPSGFDRYMSTVLGYHAVDYILKAKPDDEPKMIGMKRNRVVAVSLMESVKQTHSIADCIKTGDYARAIELRGGSFLEALDTFRTLRKASPKHQEKGKQGFRIAIMNTSGSAPGMNTATRTAVRLAIDQGHQVLGIRNGFIGFIDKDIVELDWYSVDGWTSLGGSMLGTSRNAPTDREYYPIASAIEKFEINALLIIGGFTGYQAAYNMKQNRDKYPAFNIPIICIPASINNNLPGSDYSIGSDTAINNIVDAVDKIKESSVASNRAFVVEVMGRHCGYLALMSGLATGAEKVYIHEEGITLKGMTEDCKMLTDGFKSGKHLALIIRNELANNVYTTPFISALFEEDGGDVFDVRSAILGHFQQGGNPSPFDRNIATRFSTKSINELIRLCENNLNDCYFIGIHDGKMEFTDLFEFPRMVDDEFQRPKNQWWLQLRDIGRVFERYNPSVSKKKKQA